MLKRVVTLFTVLIFVLMGFVGILWGLNGRVHATSTDPPSTFLLTTDLSPLGSTSFPLAWISETVDSVGSVGILYQPTSLALDSNDLPHISYFDAANDDLIYAHWDGAIWLTATVDSINNVGEFASLALDSNDYPHISYVDDTTDAVMHAYWNGLSWQVEIVDDSFGTFQYTSLALDSNDRPHITYHDFYLTQLKYAQWDGAIWQIETADNSAWVGEHSSLVLDSNDWPHVSYVRYHSGLAEDHLKYARWDGGSWISETVDVGGVGDVNSLVLDSNGRPHISYFDRDNTALKYTYWDGLSWQTEIVDNDGSVGWHTSLALNSNDHPQISYLDRSNEDLKYARWDGLSWQIAPVDSTENMGGFPSVALDSNEQPHISYYDYTNDQLKYAYISGGMALIAPTMSGQLIVPGQAIISVPANTFASTVRLYYTPLQAQASQPDVDVFFELSAIDVNSGLPIQPLPGKTVNAAIMYEQADVPPGLCEECLTIFGWIGKLSVWEPEPSSIVDADANTVTAELDRLGVSAILGSYSVNLPFIRH